MLFYLGEYTFPDDDWKNVTQTAKDLIRSMLTVDVNKRIDIDVFMRSPWIALPNEVPTTPLGYFYFKNSRNFQTLKKIRPKRTHK